MDFEHKGKASQRITKKGTQMNNITLATTPNYEVDKNDPVFRHKTNMALAKAVRDSVEQETIEVCGQRYIKNPG